MKSLVFIGTRGEHVCHLHLNSCESERLDTLWSTCGLSLVGEPSCLPRSKYVALAFKGLHPPLYVAGTPAGTFFNALDLGSTESCAWEPIPAFIPRGFVAPRLKLLVCFYANQVIC